MYGIIANNLSTVLCDYVYNRGGVCTYQSIELIAKNDFDSIIASLQNSTVNRLIIDTSAFNDNYEAVEFMYNLKLQPIEFNIYVISFNQEINRQIAILGIYNILEYTKNLDIPSKLEQLEFEPNTLASISDYINLNNLNANEKSDDYRPDTGPLIVIAGLDSKCYTTTLALNIVNYLNKSNNASFYVENPFKKSQLQSYFKLSLESFVKQKIINTDVEVVINSKQHAEENEILSLLLYVTNEHAIPIIDLGNLLEIKSEYLNLILNNSTHLIVIDTDSEVTKTQLDYFEKNELIQTIPIKRKVINKCNLFVDDFLTKNSNLIINDQCSMYNTIETIFQENFKIVTHVEKERKQQFKEMLTRKIQRKNLQ